MGRKNLTQTQAQAAQNSGSCPVCQGSGQRLFEETPEGWKVPIWYVEDCPRCKRKRAEQSDIGIPELFCDADLTKFNFKIYGKDLKRFEQVIWNYFNRYNQDNLSGKGLYFWSETPGSGKTFLSCCLLRSIVGRYGVQARFVTTLEYINKVAESYKRQLGETDVSQVYRDCDVLVLDDIGSQKNGGWQEQELLKLIDERVSGGRVTFFTSNFSPENLRLNERTKSRIISSALILPLPEISIRARQAQAKQDAILADLLE